MKALGFFGGTGDGLNGPLYFTTAFRDHFSFFLGDGLPQVFRSLRHDIGGAAQDAVSFEGRQLSHGYGPAHGAGHGQFYVGGNVRYAHQDLGAVQIIDAFTGNVVDTDNSINSIVFDFGTMYYPGFKDLRFGASVRNFSNQNDYFDQRFELPLTLDFGIAMNVLTLFDSAPGPENSHLMLAVDWVHPRDFSERLHVGLEYGFLDTVFLRGGYKFNYDEESFTGGLGVRLESSGYGIRADYAYGAFGDFFGSVNRLTLSILLR